MGLSLTDIRDSGLLELYVLGELAPSERLQVEEAIRTYPELKAELAQIEQSLKHFAIAASVTPNPQVLENTLEKINSGPVPPVSPPVDGVSSLSGLFGILALALAGLSGYLWFQADSVADELESTNAELAVVKAKLQACLDKNAKTTTLRDLKLRGSQIIKMKPSEKHLGSSCYIYCNAQKKLNYLALGKLKPLPVDHDYQLWSLKDSLDPVPLTVFSDSNIIVPVTYQDSTGSYAITVEKSGGATTPNLENLIGTFAIVDQER